MDIAAWLSGLGLAKYATIFAKNEITPEVLPHPSDADLEALGLPMGPRKLVLAARDAARVVDRIERLPVLLVVTFRPEFAPRWTSRPHVTLLTLNRLGQNESTVLIDHLSSGRPLPADVQAQILAKTEGVPLFVEELAKTVLESGLLRETGERYELSGSLPPLVIPSTLQDSLLARLDRLMPVKKIVQIGAVIGREFSYELLAATAQMDEPKLRTALDELVRAELAFCRDTPPDAIYTFKHALVRDAAYESLPKSRRQQLHCRIATVLRERFPDRAEAEPEELAHHATEGGLLDDAVSYWHKAGLRANYRSANAEAIAHFSRGLALLATLSETPARDNREIDLQLALGIPQLAAKGHRSAEVMAAYTRAHALCKRHGGQTSRLFPALRGLWTGYRARGTSPCCWKPITPNGRHTTASARGGQYASTPHRVSLSTDLSISLTLSHTAVTTLRCVPLPTRG